MSSCVSLFRIYGSHTGSGRLFPPENFLFDLVVVSNLGVPTQATLDATGCRTTFFFSRLKQNASLGFLVDTLHPLAPPGCGCSDNETLLWWCNKVVTSERQQCAGWTSYCVTRLMLYVILVDNVAYGAGFGVLERRSCDGAPGNKCGSVD